MIAQLDTKTVYSFMESVVSIEKYVQMAKEYGYSHLAIMDVDSCAIISSPPCFRFTTIIPF